MPKAYFKPQNNITGINWPYGFFLIDSRRSATSYAANKVFTIAANSSYKKQALLPDCNVSEPGFYSGTEMVAQQPGDLQWQTSCVSNLQRNSIIRCLKKGLGVYSRKVYTGAQRTLQESYLHINVLELLAIKPDLITFSKMFGLK